MTSEMQTASRSAPVTADRSLELLDYFRIPYSIEAGDGPSDVARVSPAEGSTLLWTSAGGQRGAYRLESMPIFGDVVHDDVIGPVLARVGGEWSRAQRIVDRHGVAVASVWRSSDGDAFLPFDPDEAIGNLLSERYLLFEIRGAFRHARTLAQDTYYAIRPLLPRPIQLSMRRRFSRIQERARFPAWPTETGLHELEAFLLGLLDELAGAPLPRIAAWPGGRSWALVLTHDVEKKEGYDSLDLMLDLERERGYRSAWYFVPQRDYVVEEHVVKQLEDDGFEVGVQGLRHDGRDLNPRAFGRRLAAMRMYAWRWNASGFRSPATHRKWELMPKLGFDYDTSYCDVARYEPQPGGCCSWLPFFLEDVVELPITLPMDHTLFELLGREDAEAWLDKTAFLRDRGGMALLLTHPDYMLSTERLEAYRRFLDEYVGDETMWHALPREVSAWWRRRGASRLEHVDGEWRVSGPAAGEARIELGPLQA